MIVAIGIAALTSLFIGNRYYAGLPIKTCFNDAGGLQPGAQVKIAGVEVGTVRGVRANPQNKSCPAEVDMRLATNYELRIPKDTLAEVQPSGGVLGAPFVNLDVKQASGPPIGKYGYLNSKPTLPQPSFEDLLKAFEVTLRVAHEDQSGKALPAQRQPPVPAADHGSGPAH